MKKNDPKQIQQNMVKYFVNKEDNQRRERNRMEYIQEQKYQREEKEANQRFEKQKDTTGKEIIDRLNKQKKEKAAHILKKIKEEDIKESKKTNFDCPLTTAIVLLIIATIVFIYCLIYVFE